MNLFWNSSSSIFFRDQTLQGVCWKALPDGRRVGLVVESDPNPPSYSTSLKPKTFIDRLQFGDGYEQITESGIRSTKRIYEVRWENIPDLRARAIQRFLLGEGSTSIYYRRPSEWFWWLPPLPLQTPGMLPLKVVCVEGWSITPNTYNSNSVSATFEETFMP